MKWIPVSERLPIEGWFGMFYDGFQMYPAEYVDYTNSADSKYGRSFDDIRPGYFRSRSIEERFGGGKNKLWLEVEPPTEATR